VVHEPLPSNEPWPPPRDSRTRISPQHQITIPIGAFRGAGLQVGDRLRAKADGQGRVVLERLKYPIRTEHSVPPVHRRY
jgi:bifunctional DNA-binding transcriptional regulator/antitoxin component of YhaV-PrlF toxin-antitoxin module